MKTQMTFSNEIEKTKKEIEVLTKKLSFLEELEKTKSPAEEAYKNWWGYYPTDTWEFGGDRWDAFQAGYNAAKEEEPEDNEWKLVALKLGEKLSDTGPGGYYDFTPGEWLEWALNAYEKLCDDTVNLLKKEKEQRVKEVVRESVKWCEEHPDKNPLDWLKPQTPKQVADGLKEAIREAIKGGIIPEVNEPTDDLIDKLTKNPPEFLKFELGQTLYALIEDWWADVFTTGSDWDSETSIDELVERIKQWLPKEQSAAGSQSIGVEDMVEGFNDAIKKIKSKLR